MVLCHYCYYYWYSRRIFAYFPVLVIILLIIVVTVLGIVAAENLCFLGTEGEGGANTSYSKGDCSRGGGRSGQEGGLGRGGSGRGGPDRE